MTNLIYIFKNPVIYPVFISSFFTQFLKFIISSIRNKKFNFHSLISTGGMPSSHSSMVMSLLTTLALNDPQGINTNICAVSLIFALIVMYDAVNIRRSAGDHAVLLNKISKIINDSKDKYEIELNENDLKEVLGHTPIEVLIGALIGIFTSILINKV